MVLVALPPPSRAVRPVFHYFPSGKVIYRVFDPTRHSVAALTFRHFGPIARFDHHRYPTSAPSHDPDRGIYYAATSVSGCVVETFGDTGVIECGDRHLVVARLIRRLRLLDLRGRGAMRAGSVAALAKIPDRACAQEWSKYFYN